MNIPGRVGYQCSNYYRQLIKEGVIHDDNYVFDNSGKLVFKFRDSEGHSALAHTKKKNVEVNTKSKKKSRSLKSGQLETEIETVEEVPLLPVQKRGKSNDQDYIDPMTMMPVVKPTISPYGHVLGYDSWIKVLNRDPRNTCPFTKKVRVEDQTYAQRLTRRSLVKLTPDNIDEYRDKIISVTGFEMDLHDFTVFNQTHSQTKRITTEKKIESITLASYHQQDHHYPQIHLYSQLDCSLPHLPFLLLSIYLSSPY